MCPEHLIGVVDDEAPVRRALGRLLRLADYAVVEYPSGEALLESLPAVVPDCLILDIRMPSLSGLETQARIRLAQVNVPVIFITGSDDPALTERVRDAGGVVLLHKPFSNAALIDAIRLALGHVN